MTSALTVRNDLDIQTLGNVLAKSGYFQDSRDASQAIVKILAGQELGISPIAAMQGINIIQGRVTISANLIAVIIKRAKPHYDYKVREFTNAICSIAFFEDGEEVGVSTFTKEDATKAGTKNMDKFPRNMLFARAISNGAKWFAAGIFGGPVYTPEELGATVDGETGEVIDVAPVPEPAPPTRSIPRQGGALPRATITPVQSQEDERVSVIERIKRLDKQLVAWTGETMISDLDLDAMPLNELRSLGEAVRTAKGALSKKMEADAAVKPVADDAPLFEAEAVAV